MAAPTPGHHHPTTAAGRKVRVIAKIRDFTDLQSYSIANGRVSLQLSPNASSIITVQSDQSSASRKECYQLDFCYDQKQGNDIIFAREVKPLISSVFAGCNATIIACGARGSGKTRLIQGNNGEPGLVMLVMAEILPLAADNGQSVKISLYEADQDHVYDLLNPDRQQVFAMKDGEGKIQLKGLSQVLVTSMSEFQQLYSDWHKPTQKTAIELPHRSHKGLIIFLLCHGEKSNSFPLGKINFVDSAGYEDVRKKSSNGLYLVENTKINKSIYALQNVVYSLSANESHVPYRESKLTHMLQDSLGGTSRILMVTCLNPFFCQDSKNVLSLASRCCQGISWPVPNFIKKNNSSTRQTVSHKGRILKSVSNATKKQPVPQVHFSGKKMNSMASSLKASKLFNEASHLKAEKASQSIIVSTINFSLQEKGEASLMVSEDVNSVSMVLQEASPFSISSASNACETTLTNKDDLHKEGIYEEVMACTTVNVGEGTNVDKENNVSQVNVGGSPPISARLQELSNNLKSLYFSTPSYIEKRQKDDEFHTAFVEPKTPEQRINVNDKEVTSFHSPWERFNTRSSGMKNSIVDEYVRLLNTASRKELKKLKGIGEKRATYILELREETPEPFKNLDDLKDIGLSAKQIKALVRKEVGELFN